MTNQNIARIQNLYGLFAKGDIPGILEMMHTDIEWEHDSIDHGIPWIKQGRGRDHVASFFGALAKLEFHAFAPEAFLGDDDKHVAVFVRHDVTNKGTGKRFSGVEIHYWTFDGEGRIARMRHFVDTAQHRAAATA